MRIILLGPTASGKTELSLLLGEALDTSIISVDSRQCYKHLDIGTAKPTSEELARVPHFNVSNLELDQEDSAIKFYNRSKGWEKEILKTSEHVLYVGGSTLHLTGLIQPFSDIPDSNTDNIELLNKRANEDGVEGLFELLKSVDPDYISKMDGLNRQRIVRALDVWMQTGKPFSSYHQKRTLILPEHTLVFGIERSREVIYDRVNRRVDMMIEKGLVAELEGILAQGYSKNLQSLQTVGYREVISFLEGEFTKDQMIEKIKVNTRRYAKRQLTWFRKWEFVQWLSASNNSPKELSEIILDQVA